MLEKEDKKEEKRKEENRGLKVLPSHSSFSVKRKFEETLWHYKLPCMYFYDKIVPQFVDHWSQLRASDQKNYKDAANALHRCISLVLFIPSSLFPCLHPVQQSKVLLMCLFVRQTPFSI